MPPKNGYGQLVAQRKSGKPAQTAVSELCKPFPLFPHEIEKILKMTWFASDEAFARFSKKLRKLGIDDKLKEMGIEEGDIIRILDYEFEYRD